MIGYHETGVGAGLRTAAIIILLTGGSLATLFTIGAFFGDVWWPLDFAANLRWWLMWALFWAAILYSIVSSGFSSIVFLAAMVLNAWIIAPMWLGSQPTGTGEDGVSVVYMDVSGGAWDTDRVLRWAFDSQVDVLIFAGTTADRIEPITVKGSPYSFIVSPDDANTAGMVVLAMEPWPVETVRTEGFGDAVYRIRVGSGEEQFALITASGKLATNAEKTDRLNARLATITEMVAGSPGPTTVVGSFGTTRWANGMRTLLGTTDLRDATEGMGYLATSPVSSIPVIGGWLGLPVDMVLMSPDVTPLELETGPDIGLGHLPISLTIGPTAGL